MRPSKNSVAMNVADAVRQRSHDADTQVGAVLVKNETGAIIATGTNGFVRGANDANIPNTRPEKYEYIVHAEENMIANCSFHGIATKECTLVCTLTPCVRCTRLLWQSGVTKVIAKEKYRDFEDLQKMKDISIDIAITEEGFFELTYRVRK